MRDLELYLTDYVMPVIGDFERNVGSLRHAFIACVVTFHAVDYLAHPKTSRPLRQKWDRDCPAFKIVDEVAHAFKYVVTGAKTRPKLRAKEVVASLRRLMRRSNEKR